MPGDSHAEVPVLYLSVDDDDGGDDEGDDEEEEGGNGKE